MRWLLLVAGLVPGCGRIGFGASAGSLDDASDGPVGDGPPGDSGAACAAFGPWTTPVRVDSLSTNAVDWEASLHPDGDLIAFSSTRNGGNDLFLADWNGTASNIRRITELSTGDEYTPTWSADGKKLYFSRTFIAPRLFGVSFTNGTFGTPALEPGLESVDVVSATISADGTEMLFSDFMNDLGRATFDGSTWTPDGLVGVSGGFPELSNDGLTLFYENQPGPTKQIWQATRTQLGMPFADAKHITELDLASTEEGDPRISRDGKTMLLSATQGGFADVFLAQRDCL